MDNIPTIYPDETMVNVISALGLHVGHFTWPTKDVPLLMAVNEKSTHYTFITTEPVKEDA